jgi:hypothetical protein
MIQPKRAKRFRHYGSPNKNSNLMISGIVIRLLMIIALVFAIGWIVCLAK